MKRSKKPTKITKTYDDTQHIHLSQKESDELMKKFLEAGGIVYTAGRGRKKGGLTKAQIREHNEEVLKKLKEQGQNK